MKKNKAQLTWVAGTVQAGKPCFAIDAGERELSLDEYLVEKPLSTFMVRVSGQSMIEAGIFDGDVLVVEKGKAVKNNQIVIAAVNGELTVKRILIEGEVGAPQKVVLKAENKDFKPLEFAGWDEVEVWGVAVGVVRKI